MNSSVNKRKHEKSWWIRNKGIFYNILIYIILGFGALFLIVCMVNSISSCNRTMAKNEYHAIEGINFHAIPLSDTPLLITDSTSFEDKDKTLTVYYNYVDEINKYKLEGIPLNRVIFLGRQYGNSCRCNDRRHEKGIFIEVQDSALGLKRYKNNWNTKQLLNYLRKNPNVNYKIYGEIDSISKYVSVKRKAQ